MSTPTSQDTLARSVTNRRVLIGSLSGSAIEWYDFLLYGTVAPIIFSKQFFPEGDPFVQLMAAFFGQALTFLIRPFGGVFFAYIGDRLGRKKTLVLTLTIMGLGTVAIGLLPTYAQIGVWAPVLLYLFRIIQGLAIGGEWGGALLLAHEYAPKGRRGFFGSIPQIGVTIGLLLGNAAILLANLLPSGQFEAWGWRVPFVFSIVLVAIGLWIRAGLEETPAFRAFIVAYATDKTIGYQRGEVLTAILVGAAVATVAIPVMGALSDRFGRRPTYMVGVVVFVASAFAYFPLVNTGSVPLLIAASVMSLGLAWAPVTATLGTMMSETFSSNVRYTGITLGYQIGAAIFSGTAPMIALALWKGAGGSWVPIALYWAAIGALSLAAAWAAKHVSATDTLR